MPRHRCDGLLDEGGDRHVRRDKNAAVWLRCRRCHGALDVRKPVNLTDGRLNAERRSGRFKRARKKHSRGIIRILNHTNVCNVRRNVFECLQHLADD